MRAITSLSVWIIACAFLMWVSVAAADNLVYNGDFSLGDVGFSSDYQHVSFGDNQCWLEGVYTVGTDPSGCHISWASFGDHTTGIGNMMIINGAKLADRTVWQETVHVKPGMDYQLSGWVASSYPVSPATLLFSITGLQDENQSKGTFAASPIPGLWEEFFLDWNSGMNDTALLTIIDTNLDPIGNDFALDDISFVAVPEPASFLLFGSAVLVAARASRRKLAAGPGKESE